ncbi:MULTISPECIES: dihydrofolate reductase family protein [Paenibacillus]|uniref:dihydrofolate reductase family protein n=1 Tax=Paenibacillus TaxID=44249 RepID=UPI0022B88D07|nr:dihydrofolate reductase [Paenibacillus caseinilyticus]MCZ8519625.1 dihydrofolate reductase [Paenibacillus caseinilyticus]
MKTILWATLTANGNYAQSSPEHPPKPEALTDFVLQAKAAGNFIVGRRTFEGMQASGGGELGNLDIVVVSRGAKEIPGVTVACSPQEALAYLQHKGHLTALISGGADLHNVFLGHRLVDEIIFNIAPVLEGKGLNLLLDKGHYQYKDMELLDFKSLGGGVIQLHYAVGQE